MLGEEEEVLPHMMLMIILFVGHEIKNFRQFVTMEASNIAAGGDLLLFGRLSEIFQLLSER